MNIPNELLLMSLRYLNKADLKNARLVSKQWSDYASEHLFTKLFISPQRLNLEIFTNIAGDSKLSKCVKELECNTIHFTSNITISEYFDVLWCQCHADATAYKDSDPEIHHFVTFLNDSAGNWNKSGAMIAEAKSHCYGFAFIQEGYRRWMEEARYERGCIDKGILLEVLTTGLKKLNRLRTVKLLCDWPYTGKLNRRGSPLARSWNHLHAHPDRWVPDCDRFLRAYHANIHFHSLMTALPVAGITNLRNLSIESKVTPATLLEGSLETQIYNDDYISTYSGLKTLKLSFAGRSDGSMFMLYDNLYGVPRMLEPMTALQQLELGLPDDYNNDSVVYFPYPIVFPANGHWPYLTTLMVRNLSIGTRDLITLLSTKLPSLQHLTFGNMRLLDGHWEGIIEYLRMSSNKLSSFRLAPESFLVHRENHVYVAEGRSLAGLRQRRIGKRYFANERFMVKYVVNGWKDPTLKHPSLMPGQPAHQSGEYLQDVFRLCGVDHMGDIQQGALQTPRRL